MENAIGTDSAIVFSGIAPHPPIMVPEVGGDACGEVTGSIEAMAEFTNRIIKAGAETVVLISPHAPLDARAFVAYPGPLLFGSFAKFRAPLTQFSFELDQPLLDAITTAANQNEFDVVIVDEAELDHGAAVPLYFLDRNGWNGRVVVLGYSFLPNEDHLDFGASIRKAVDKLGRPVALVASGDLSHRLKPNAPAGYNPEAHAFDEQVVESLRHNSPQEIADTDHELRRMAGECGFRSMLVALGAIRGLQHDCDVLHYEAPFGVGYLVAQLTNINASEPAEANVSSQDACAPSPDALSLPALAREAVETFVRTGKQIAPPASPSGILTSRAACFVTIRSKSSGDLRGCIGTVEPTKGALAEELIANAIKAATHDPRFGPVSPDELPRLRYSVDVLSPPEPATFDDLDPKVYGLIVEDEKRELRGLLLPDIEGVETASTQVEIASRKAGIPPGTPLRFFRFRVDRYREK
ncbi:MAG TPA: AmmeMemoRadiSam system protein A [Pyrinomonadaceae bacterium]|nr:AmmeMemoRadiSam system protein A [Pyrinomonadaceae bacterium]